MITLISFIILIAGAINWLIIGLMQYDFVAGIFGTQSSMLSRLIYIIIGVSAIWIVLMSFVQKGRIKINDNGFKTLNKLAPTKETENKEEIRHDSKLNNYEYSAKQQTPPNPSPHEYSHPNTTDAGQEFHSQNSGHKRNPFD